MINVELQNLIKHLEPTLKTSLEAAAGECLSRCHFCVEPEHWFFDLINNSALGWHLAINQSPIELGFLIANLNQRFESFPKGNESTPSLSAHLVELLKDAWMLASLNLSQFTVNEFHLLLVLKQRADLSFSQMTLAPWISTLSTEWLLQQAKKTPNTSFQSVTNFSNEQSVSGLSALEKYSRNLTQAAKNNELEVISGRNSEIRKSIDILCRRRQNSPILVGDPGVGKTAIVEGLAQHIVSGNVPPSLLDVELYSLDLTALQAGASIKGEFENRLKDIINEIKQSITPIIVFIDEAHSLIGAGGSAGKNDAANILKPALARGEFRSIAATTWAEYKQYFETDAALTRRFQLVAVEEPDYEDCLHMLYGMKDSLEKHHKVKVMKEAMEAAVSLSIRYLPERKLPDKAISLLDTSCSRIALSQNAIPNEIDDLVQKIRYKQKEIEILQSQITLGLVDEENLIELELALQNLWSEKERLELRWQQEKDLINALLFLQNQLNDIALEGNSVEKDQIKSRFTQKMKELDLLQGDRPMIFPYVSSQAVAEVISLWTGIPVGNMLKEEMDKLKNIESYLASRVIGQQTPIAEIAKAIRLSRARLTAPEKPIGVFLFCGPSGVGKTETALALTDLLYGGKQNITTINMTEFKEEHKVSMLLGAPAGYVGYGKGGILTEAVRKNPYSVLLLDEMEKAHSGVHDIFYQIFDKGSISDSEGREIDFSNCIIIMTSNAADSEVVNACVDHRPDIPKLTQDIFPVLQEFFKPAFLGRTTIVPYYPLNDEEMAQIAKLALKKIKNRVKQHHGAEFLYDDEVINKLISLNNSPEIGARAIEQIINRQLMPNIAQECINRMSLSLPINQIQVLLNNGSFVTHIN